MKYHSIIIDTNNLYWRIASTVMETTTVKFDGASLFPQTIERCVKQVQRVRTKFGTPETNLYFLFDNPMSKINWREELTGGKYKHPRKDKEIPEGFYHSLILFRQILKDYSDRFFTINVPNHEADDLTKPLIRHIKISPEIDKLLLISADLDWSRNLSPYVDWYDWKTVFTQTSFQQLHGYLPTENSVIMFKSLNGDPSDAINKGCRLPTERIIALVDKYGSLDSMWKDVDNIPEKAVLVGAKSKIELNEKLVSFSNVSNEDLLCELSQCRYSPTMLRVWYKTLGLTPEEWMLAETAQKEELFTMKKV